MDPVRNPYAPGAGSPPPELAGRSDVLTAGTTALQRVALGRATQSLILVGLRGVGKTVLLNRLNEAADEHKFKSAFIEAHEGKRLPELIAPSLRTILFSLSTIENSKELARRGLRGLKGFLSGLNLSVGGDEGLSLGVDAEAGLADSGSIEADLPELILAIAEAAKAAGKPVAIFLDELQYLEEREFSALIMAVHRVNQRSLPLILVGAGLPQIRGLAGNSKSYAERLFRYPEIGALSHDDAVAAIVRPAADEGVSFSDEAVERVIADTEKYPYFLQQWGYEAWNAAESEHIDLDVIVRASVEAVRELDQSFFRVRLDRCTPSEKRYMRALAEMGRGKHRSGDVADKLGLKVTSAAPTRSALIRKGMIYSPAHGDTAFTVPLFDTYMRREMPVLPGAAEEEAE
ncbi:ATP-binding protein [Methylobacterium platani]|uniref:ATPase AAA n=1 Tax=Methylobacterium platani JCM 14648 TaxID=1295136 RepID=A0ABR5GNE0_9HYPH|nr:ATP-binding protein [Methylobacterium platani]KMO10282.1 ATPase AAA [Methylobacterium platani JCM 14648]